MDMDTLLYVTWRTRKDLLDSTGDSAQCHVAAWMEGSLGEKRYMCMYGWVPLLSIRNHPNIVNRLYPGDEPRSPALQAVSLPADQQGKPDYTSIQNKIFKRKNNLKNHPPCTLRQSARWSLGFECDELRWKLRPVPSLLLNLMKSCSQCLRR